jgi:molecular chaperone GrpE
MISDIEGAGLSPELPLGEESLSLANEPPPFSEPAGVPGQQAPQASEAERIAEPLAAGPVDKTAALLTTISEAIERLAVSSEHYHDRAEQRETVIDHLHSEVDRLRRGERRGLLRPLLVEFCRLRNDLLRQAEDLPADFDADRARLLLRSYAESVELALEDSGVATFAPAAGDQFEPRLHRRVGGETTGDPGLVGRVARVRRSGYLDIDTNAPIAPAEVLLFALVGAEPPEGPDSLSEPSDPDESRPDRHGPASATGERKEL